MKLHRLIPFLELISKGLSFIGVILITRMISVESFGLYYYVISVVAWASVVMDGGISYYAINRSINDDVGQFGLFAILQAFVFIYHSFSNRFYFLFFKPTILIEIALYGLTFIAILMTAFFKIISRTQGFFKTDLLAVITEPVLRILFLLIAFVFYESVELNHVFFILLISAIISFAVCYKSFLNNTALKFDFRLKLSGMIGVLKETKYFMLMYFFLVGYKRIEIILTDIKFGDTDTGLFSSADNFYSSAYLFFTSLILVGIKDYLKHKKQEKIKQFFYILALVSLSVLIINFGSEILYDIIYKPAYFEGAKYLKILSFSLLFTPFIYYLILKNNYEDKTKQNFLILTFGFVFKTILLIMTINMSQFVLGIVLSDLVLLLSFLYGSKFVKKTPV